MASNQTNEATRSQSIGGTRPLKVKTVEHASDARGRKAHGVEIRVGALVLHLQCASSLHAQVVTDAIGRCEGARVTGGTLDGGK